MSNFDKAIEIILAEPTELHYPAYYADLLRKADVPDKDAGKCSEIPNSSETIYRQAAIDMLSKIPVLEFKKTDDGLLEALISIGQTHEALKQLPSAQPERKKGKWIVDALANNIWHCSECGTDAPVEPTGGTEYKSNYCPYCGLDMRGEENETD